MMNEEKHSLPPPPTRIVTQEQRDRWSAARRSKSTPESRAAKAAQMKAWRETNPETAKAKARVSREKNRDKTNAKMRARYHANPERFKAENRKWREANAEKRKSRQRAAYAALSPEKRQERLAKGKARRVRHIREDMLRAAKKRAEQNGLPFDLVPEDIVIPEFCPVLPWIPLRIGVKKFSHSSPTLERKIPAKGYVRGNVHVISWRANNLRRDGTARELEYIARYAREVEDAG